VSRRVSLSAPTVRTLNSTLGPDHDLSRCHPRQAPFISAPRDATRDCQRVRGNTFLQIARVVMRSSTSPDFHANSWRSADHHDRFPRISRVSLERSVPFLFLLIGMSDRSDRSKINPARLRNEQTSSKSADRRASQLGGRSSETRLETELLEESLAALNSEIVISSIKRIVKQIFGSF